MSDELFAALRDEYENVPVPSYPVSAIAAARLARGPGRRSAPLLRLAAAGVGGIVIGALAMMIPGPPHDAMLAYVARHAAAPRTADVASTDTSAAPRTVSLEEARRLATFPIVVPRGVPVDMVRIGGDNASVQMIVSPRSGDRVMMVERPADAQHDDGDTSWRAGSTAVTVLSPPDGSIVQRLRTATVSP
ncbi:MAG TPA: hypothetical protein VGN14_07070 [Candidatus Elarobacter sp.]|jgi:hypothetical protein